MLFALQRKMSRSEIKRVYIVRPERKAIQKHLKNELGSKRNKDKRINSQVSLIFERSLLAARKFANLLASLKSEKISLFIKICCKLLKHIASSLWIKSLDSQLAASKRPNHLNCLLREKGQKKISF